MEHDERLNLTKREIEMRVNQLMPAIDRFNRHYLPFFELGKGNVPGLDTLFRDLDNPSRACLAYVLAKRAFEPIPDNNGRKEFKENKAMVLLHMAMVVLKATPFAEDATIVRRERYSIVDRVTFLQKALWSHYSLSTSGGKFPFEIQKELLTGLDFICILSTGLNPPGVRLPRT